MPNLKEETIARIQRCGKNPGDVVQVQDDENACTWEQFLELADRDYDADYGLVEVDTSLRVLFRDGSWLERMEYDGSEWWVLKEPPPLREINGKLKLWEAYGIEEPEG